MPLEFGNVYTFDLDLGCCRSEILSTYRAASLFEVLPLTHVILAIDPHLFY